ncbi:MAG: hypothetical protein ACO3MV_08675 [Flavobacteriales bacterium]
MFKKFMGVVMLVVGISHGSFAQDITNANQNWVPDYDSDQQISMQDVLPLLGIFGSTWNQSDDAELKYVLMDWSGRESEALLLPPEADVIIMRSGVNDLSDPEQYSKSIRHIVVEPRVQENQGLETHPQLLLLDVGKDANEHPMKYGTEYILHLPDGSFGRVSTHSLGGLSSSGIPMRTAAYLIHLGGSVYYGQ